MPYLIDPQTGDVIQCEQCQQYPAVREITFIMTAGEFKGQEQTDAVCEKCSGDCPESDYGEPMPPPRGEERRPYLSKNIVSRLRGVADAAEAWARLTNVTNDQELTDGIAWIRRLSDWHDKRRRA